MGGIRASAAVRGALKQLPGVKSAYYLSMVLRQMAADQWRRPATFDRIFAVQPDPWESGSPSEQERFALTLSVLAGGARERYGNAVELGCAEGIFTRMLAPSCDRLLGLDFSEVALVRARQRLRDLAGVRFERWDMRRELLEGRFDLVVAMGVLTSLYRPNDVRRCCEMVIGAVEPGGLLLFSDVRQSRVFETAWWGRFVLRGGEQIRRLLVRQPGLELVSSADTASHVFALFRRRADARGRATMAS